MVNHQSPRGVHLNGSVPLANADEVFRVASSILGDCLYRIPDGETGVRTNWIGWQIDVLARNSSFEMISPDPNAYASLPHFRMRPGASTGDYVFDQLGYADAALSSYAVFSQLTQAGALQTQYRFQLSLSTPLAPVTASIVEPENTSKLVDVANGISAGLKRSLNWISMPVPRNRSDDAYFAPLKNLQLHPETELYLGLVHFTDGVEGTRRRIEAAQRVVADFGVATECGLGRRPPETIPDLLRIHSEVAAPH